MTLNRKLLSVAVLSLLIGLSSCNDDDKNANQLSKADAQNALTQFNNEAVGDLQSLTDATAIQAIHDLAELTETDDPFGRIGGSDKEKIKHFFQKKGRDFKTIFAANKAVAGRTASDEAFDFEANLGVYEWNATLGEEGAFERTGESEIIEIQFPTEGSSTNNAALQLTAYSEIEVYDEEWGEYSYQPELITAFLFVNDVKVIGLHFEASWDELGFPLNVDIALSIEEFKFDIVFDDSGATTSSLSISLLRNTETIVATNVTVKYEDDSKSEASLKSLEGFIQIKNLKLEGDINVKAADAADVNWNDIINLALYNEGKKLGDVVFVEEDGEFIAYLQYADGSKEKLDIILQPVLDELDELELEFNTNG